jgi:hypothetical protein
MERQEFFFFWHSKLRHQSLECQEFFVFGDLKLGYKLRMDERKNILVEVWNTKNIFLLVVHSS